jgi:hypothetical protein
MTAANNAAPLAGQTPGLWAQCRAPVLLTIVGGAIDTIGFIALLGFFTAHVTGNLVLAGAAFVKGGAGLWIKLGAIPLFIATVMMTKMWIDRCSPSSKTLGWLFVAEACFSAASWSRACNWSRFATPRRRAGADRRPGPDGPGHTQHGQQDADQAHQPQHHDDGQYHAAWH